MPAFLHKAVFICDIAHVYITLSLLDEHVAI
jgi:hypothetical protein